MRGATLQPTPQAPGTLAITFAGTDGHFPVNPRSGRHWRRGLSP